MPYHQMAYNKDFKRSNFYKLQLPELPHTIIKTNPENKPKSLIKPHCWGALDHLISILKMVKDKMKAVRVRVDNLMTYGLGVY